VRPVDAYPAAGEYDHPWDALAGHLGSVTFEPINVNANQAEPDHFEPQDQIVGTAEAIAEPSVSSYRLGSVAVETAGVSRADQLPGEERTKERYRQFLGGVAMHGSQVEAPNAPKLVHRSSLDILRSAAEGDKTAFEALLLEARTHIGEVFGGVGEGMDVELEVNDSGEVVWSGQTTEARQFHVLSAYPDQAPEIREAVHAEGLAGFRLEDRRREGQLEGRAVFDFSAMPDASQEELAEWGYYLSSIACAIRRSSFVDGKCQVSSVFVAGVDQRLLPPRRPGETQADEIARHKIALQNRIDVWILRRMHGLFGTEHAKTMTPAEILSAPLAAPEEFDTLDMAMLYDILAAEEVEGDVKTFFGSVELWQGLGSPEQLTREHYEAHTQQREARQKQYNTLCEDIVREQVRRQGEALTPREAVELKRRVVLDMTVECATRDTTIDATRFGRVAAELIDAARESYARGDDSGGDKLTNQAKDKAIDPSCPPGERDKLKNAADDSKEKDDCNEVKDGDEVHCPYCDQVVRAIVPERGGRIYCSNKKCDAAITKETMQEKMKDSKHNAKPGFLLQLTSAKQNNKAKNNARQHQGSKAANASKP
jgi:hypothetical protein